MYSAVFQQLGLSKNESRIYETLIREGELSVGQISQKSQVHRRNVYDSLNRLVEKGLVFEILHRQENHYQGVEPNKLMELINEKQQTLQKIMPDLENLYRAQPRQQQVCIYRGIEGWKNYMRDILRVGEDLYCIGGKGAWMDERLKTFFPKFLKQAEDQEITFHYLFDHEVKSGGLDIVEYVGEHYRFLPEGYSSPACVDVFGPHINFLSDIKLGRIEQDFSFTVIVDQQIADSFRCWFRYMWDFLPEEKSSPARGTSKKKRAA